MNATNAPSTHTVGMTFASFADFSHDATAWLSKDQVFISTDDNLAIGTPVAIDVSLADGTPLVRGLGRVSWVRKQAIRQDRPAGVGVGLIHLDSASAALVDAMLQARAASPSELAATDASPQAMATDASPPGEPPATGATPPTAKKTKIIGVDFVDEHHFGEEGIGGFEPYIPDGHELDKLRDVSFSDVERAVSREIDAAVLPSDIRTRLQSGASSSPADREPAVPDTTHEARADDADPIDRFATDDLELDDAEITDPIDRALAEIKRPAETVESKTAETDDTDDERAEALAAAVAQELAAAEDHDADNQDTTPVQVPADDRPAEASDGEDTQAVLELETEAVELSAPSSPPSEAVEPEDVELASDELASDEPEDVEPEDVELASDEPAGVEPEDVELGREESDETMAVAEVATSDEEDERVADEAADEAIIEQATTSAAVGAAAIAGEPKRPAYDPWDLDVSSFIDEALRERAAQGKGQDEDPLGDDEMSTEVMPPPDMIEPEDGDDRASSIASATTVKPGTAWTSRESDVGPSSAAGDSAREDDDTLDIGPGKTPEGPERPSAPERPSLAASALPTSEHPEALQPPPGAEADDKTLSFGKADTMRDAVRAAEARAAGDATDMETEPDFGTMETHLELPEPPADTLADAPAAEETAPVTLPAGGLARHVAAAERRTAAEREAAVEPSEPDLATLAEAAAPTPPEPADAAPRSGYYAEAGRKRKRTLRLLVAALAALAIGAALFFTGMLDGPFASLSSAMRGGEAPAASPSAASTAPPESAPPSMATAPLQPAEPSDATSSQAVPPATDAATGETGGETAMPELPPPAPGGPTPTAADTPAVAEPVATAPEIVDPAALEAQLRRTAEQWAAAWSSQDPDAYLAAYDVSFEPADGLDRAAWEAQRRTRIRAPSSLTVQVSDLTVDAIEGDRATVRFFQSYRAVTAAGRRNLGTWKRFELVRRPDGWRIARESLVR